MKALSIHSEAEHGHSEVEVSLAKALIQTQHDLLQQKASIVQLFAKMGKAQKVAIPDANDRIGMIDLGQRSAPVDILGELNDYVAKNLSSFKFAPIRYLKEH